VLPSNSQLSNLDRSLSPRPSRESHQGFESDEDLSANRDGGQFAVANKRCNFFGWKAAKLKPGLSEGNE
jgi:hypothetical protein